MSMVPWALQLKVFQQNIPACITLKEPMIIEEISYIGHILSYSRIIDGLGVIFTFCFDSITENGIALLQSLRTINLQPRRIFQSSMYNFIYEIKGFLPPRESTDAHMDMVEYLILQSFAEFCKQEEEEEATATAIASATAIATATTITTNDPLEIDILNSLATIYDDDFY